jgi:hypothetical protein
MWREVLLRTREVSSSHSASPRDKIQPDSKQQRSETGQRLVGTVYSGVNHGEKIEGKEE